MVKSKPSPSYHGQGHFTKRPVFLSRQRMFGSSMIVDVGMLLFGVSDSGDVSFDVRERRQHLGDGRLLSCGLLS